MTDDVRHRMPVQVRFRDVDAFGHVNNAVFFSYVELARIRYLLDVLEVEADFSTLPLILARVEIDFRAPIYFGDDPEVETRVDRIGNSSFSMSHRMTAGPDRHLVAEVDSVLVTYDYEASRPIRVPDEWRARMTAFEGRQIETDAPRTQAAAST
ncbi:MAG TPA: thioesterase family protein [Candidatus Limnocylindria bacterium]